MARWILLLLAAGVALQAQDSNAPPPAQGQGELKRDRSEKAPPKESYPPPPEEDESIAPTHYSFNPLQSERDVTVGEYYFKQGKYRAAAGRFREATRWNEKNSEAWLRLGEASEKAKDKDAAREAYTKYLALASDAKNAAEIKKRVARLK
jgi:tetratricopeptide (TPR) repeat protein